MSDHDAAPDPLDKAYAQAEALLSDDAARAARRARVLAAVTQATQQAAPPAPQRAWPPAGWLVAASVAGLSVLVALQIRPPVSIERPVPPQAPTAPAASPVSPDSPGVTAPATPAVPTGRGSNAPPPIMERRAETPSQRSPSAAAALEPMARDDAMVEASPPPPPPPPPPPSPVPPVASAAAPAAAPPAPRSSQGVSEIVVTSSRAEPREARRVASAAKAASGLAVRLRQAAARGRTSEVAALLAKGVAVDAPDDDGDTALMESVRANHPAVAALLRRHGADLDLKNRAGQSARDMATSIGDAELDRALGLDG